MPAKISNPLKLRLLLILIFLGVFSGREEFYSEYILLLVGICVFLAFKFQIFWLWCVAVLFFGIFYGQLRNTLDLQKDGLPALHGQEVILQGYVDSFPDFRTSGVRTYFQVQAVKVSEQEKFKPISGRLLLITKPTTKLQYGDAWQFRAKPQAPRNFKNFDYQAFLRRAETQTLVRHPRELELLASQSGGSALLRNASGLREFFAKNLQNSLPPHHATIARGILLGIKNELPETIKADFHNSGLQHLLVVSGTNVGVVILLVAFLLQKSGRPLVFLGSLALVSFFIAMTGAEPPVIRAGIMGLLISFAMFLGRDADVQNVFFLGITLLAIHDPKVVQGDVGFFLSAAATYGIILWASLLNDKLTIIPEFAGLRMILAVTLAAQLAVLPIIGWHFESFPVAGLAANLAAEPLVALGMGFSALSVIFGSLPSMAATFFSIPSFIILEALLWVAHVFGQLPVVVVPKIFAGGMGGVVAVLFVCGALKVGSGGLSCRGEI